MRGSKSIWSTVRACPPRTFNLLRPFKRPTQVWIVPFFPPGSSSFVASLSDNVRVGFAYRDTQVVGVFRFPSRGVAPASRWDSRRPIFTG